MPICLSCLLSLYCLSQSGVATSLGCKSILRANIRMSPTRTSLIFGFKPMMLPSTNSTATMTTMTPILTTGYLFLFTHFLALALSSIKRCMPAISSSSLNGL
ncbi:hypothetical protein [Moraxella lacunata]|uniref:hypothetical protein n=1 Tax=Moraxella lacunata TaxID=477 RepID=UPI003EDEE91F